MFGGRGCINMCEVQMYIKTFKYRKNYTELGGGCGPSNGGGVFTPI